MKRDDFFAQLREQDWVLTNRLQEKVMAIVHGMGAAFEVGEVDIHPDERVVYVFGSFRGKRMRIMTSRPFEGPHADLSVEMYFSDHPDVVSEPFAQEIRRLSEEAGIDLFVRRTWLAMGTEARGIATGEELTALCDHLLTHVSQAEKLLKEEENAVPFEPKKATAAVPRRGATLVN